MKKATNYVRGWVRVEAVGPYPERFINILSARGIPFWKVERVDETTVRLTLPFSMAKQALALGGKCLCEIRQIDRAGVPELLLKLKNRYGMLTGLLLSLVAVMLLSRFVMVIEITGETELPHGVILTALREAGLYPGVYGPAVDERAISNRMLLEVEELGFLSVNLHGIRAEVVVRDGLEKPELEPTQTQRDLIAKKGGRILSVEDLAGEVLVGPGDFVEAGEVLIRGEMTITNADGSAVLTTYPVWSKGVVWAQVEEVFSASTPLTCVGKRYTGEKADQFEVVVLGKSFKISGKAFQPFAEYDKIEHTYTLQLGENLTLPLSLVVRRCVEYEPTVLTLDPESGEAYLRRVLSQRLNCAIGEDGSIIKEEWSVKSDNGALTVTVNALCREQIAVGKTEE